MGGVPKKGCEDVNARFVVYQPTPFSWARCKGGGQAKSRADAPYDANSERQEEDGSRRIAETA